MAKKEYVLVDIDEHMGRLNGTTMWRITWVDGQDSSIWETTVDPTYRNFTRSGWDRIVESENPWGVYTGLVRSSRTTEGGVAVLTADSHPQLIEPITEADAFRIVQALHDRRHANSGQTRFGELFR